MNDDTHVEISIERLDCRNLRLRGTASSSDRLKTIIFRMLLATVLASAHWNNAMANQEATINQAYWQEFITEMDAVLLNNEGNLAPINEILSKIDISKPITDSKSVLESSRFYVDHAYSGLPNVYDYANKTIIVYIYFDKNTGLVNTEQTGARLKKTKGDYRIKPIN